MTKYEKLIEYIINDEEDKARQLFHQIVVEKSREIYESIMDEETMGGNPVESLVDEVTGDEHGMHEDDDMDLDVDMVADEPEMDADAAMDMDAEMGDDEGMGGDQDMEDRVMDLEDALDELKAEFDALMADEAGEEEHGEEDLEDAEDDLEDDEDDEEDAEEDEEDDEEDLQEAKKMKAAKEKQKLMDKKHMSEAARLREYTEKLGDIYSQEPAQGEGHEVGQGKKAKVDSKSIVAGKNDMGGSNKNIARGGAEQDPDNKQIPEPNNEYTKGKGKLPHAGQFKNVPGGNAGKTAYKTKEGEYSTEHGKEGRTTGDTVSVSSKSVLKAR